jgi:predicted nuclease of predicted toxin-antitoxin system
MLEDLDTSTDAEIWQFAYEHTYTIVTKDSDFNDIAVFKGVPPKVIWIKLGNCRVVDIENVLKANESVIKSFIQADNSAILEI